MEDILKTSQEWCAFHEEEDGKLIIMDPDGWDRTNYEFSFNEEMITKEEFTRRLHMSTTIIYKDDGETKNNK